MAESLRRKTTEKQAGPEQPRPTELAQLRLNVLHTRQAYGRARLAGGGRLKPFLALVQWLLARLNAFRPMRVWQHYSLQHGPLLSAGIGFNMFFSILGLLATGFSIAGLVLAGQPELVDRVVHSVAQSAPGLLKVDGSEGLADPKALLNRSGLGLTAVIAAVVTVLTSLGWITSLRDGLRGVVGLQPLKVNPVLQRLKDAGTLLILGVALVLTSGVSIIFTAALGFIESLLQLDRGLVDPVGWLIGILVPFALNWLTAFIMFRLAGGLRLSRRAVVEGTFIAGLGTSVLQLFSSQLLARAGANPLLAPFAIIIGLLIWFNLVSQVYLASAAWSAIREADSAIPARRRSAVLRARSGRRPSRALTRSRAHARRTAEKASSGSSGEDSRGVAPRSGADDAGGSPAAARPAAGQATRESASVAGEPPVASDGGLRRPRDRRRAAPWPVQVLRGLRPRGARYRGEGRAATAD